MNIQTFNMVPIESIPNEIPDAHCILVKPTNGSDNFQWRVLCCPHCGSQGHRHGADWDECDNVDDNDDLDVNNEYEIEESMLHSLGHRTAHCINGDPTGVGYNLVWHRPEVNV